MEEKYRNAFVHFHVKQIQFGREHMRNVQYSFWCNYGCDCPHHFYRCAKYVWTVI